MIPDNPNIFEVTNNNQFLLAPFKYPDNIALEDYLTDFEMGGVAIQDPSLGLNYQPWKGYWDPVDDTAYIHPLNTTDPPTPILTESDVEDFTFTFDQNMRWTAAVRKDDNTVKFYWYDSVIEDYTVSTYSGITSVKLAHDDHRDNQVPRGVTDVIITYITSAGTLKWRIQRDRYINEYSKGGISYSKAFMITHFGLSEMNRLQWRIGLRRRLIDGHCV
jgi:hypothetical protein